MICPRCNGTGLLPDDRKIGAEMRAKRQGAGLTLRDVARRMGKSAAYLCDLELGRRGWHTNITKAYLEALK